MYFCRLWNYEIKGLCTIITHNKQGTWFSDTIIVYSGSLKWPSIIKTQQNIGHWYSDTGIGLSSSCKQLSIIFNRCIWNRISSDYRLAANLFWMISSGLYYMCIYGWCFYQWCQCFHWTCRNYIKGLNVLNKD